MRKSINKSRCDREGRESCNSFLVFTGNDLYEVAVQKRQGNNMASSGVTGPGQWRIVARQFSQPRNSFIHYEVSIIWQEMIQRWVGQDKGA
jgi:hypothetical protein